MCHQTNTISKNIHGQLSFCTGCKVYHLIFNNLFFEFTQRELTAFQKYVDQIEVGYWETKYDRMVMKRKIPIQTMQQNLSIMFNREELQSLRCLISQNTKKPNDNLKVLDIDYQFFLN